MLRGIMLKALIVPIISALLFTSAGCDMKYTGSQGSTSASTTIKPATSNTIVQEVAFEGYLIDKHCFAIKQPDQDTRMCLLMASCEASGYGVAVKQADGTFVFHPFDANGRRLAKEYLTATSKTVDFIITVTGSMDGDIVNVTAFAEK